jgi:glycosyltransferase involved in cell wall biosynthesis
MKQQYLQANVYVCASTNENSPNSVGEAMILGTPAVCSRVGGIPTLFAENADGVMFVPEDIEGLADAICHVFSGGVAVEMQTAHARAHALSTHDPEANYKALLKIYADIAAS